MRAFRVVTHIFFIAIKKNQLRRHSNEKLTLRAFNVVVRKRETRRKSVRVCLSRFYSVFVSLIFCFHSNTQKLGFLPSNMQFYLNIH